MKKVLLAAVAIATFASASSSFAGGCGTSYVTVAQQHCEPRYTYVVQEPCHQQVISVQTCNPCHVEERVILQQPCHTTTTTYVKPCVETYRVQTPVIYNFDYGCQYTPSFYNYRCAPSSCGH